MIKAAALAFAFLLATPLEARQPTLPELLPHAFAQALAAEMPAMPDRVAIDLGMLFGISIVIEPSCVMEGGELERCELPEPFPVRSYGGEPPSDQAS